MSVFSDWTELCLNNWNIAANQAFKVSKEASSPPWAATAETTAVVAEHVGDLPKKQTNGQKSTMCICECVTQLNMSWPFLCGVCMKSAASSHNGKTCRLSLLETLHCPQWLWVWMFECLCVCGDAGCSFLSETVKVPCSNWAETSKNLLQDSVHRTLMLHHLCFTKSFSSVHTKFCEARLSMQNPELENQLLLLWSWMRFDESINIEYLARPKSH